MFSAEELKELKKKGGKVREIKPPHTNINVAAPDLTELIEQNRRYEHMVEQLTAELREGSKRNAALFSELTEAISGLIDKKPRSYTFVLGKNTKKQTVVKAFPE